MPTKDPSNVSIWLLAVVMAWNGWMSIQIISMRSDIQAAILTHNNVIPPIVETSLSELRLRLNNDQQDRNKLMEIVIENRGDITHIKQELVKAK